MGVGAGFSSFRIVFETWTQRTFRETLSCGALETRGQSFAELTQENVLPALSSTYRILTISIAAT